MNIRYVILSAALLAAALSVLCFTNPAVAATYTWNGGPSGTWDTSGTNWNGGGTSPWDLSNGPSNIASFNTASLNASVGGTVYTNGIIFGTTGAVGNGTINLAGPAPTITANADGTIGSALGGSAGLTKSGNGTLMLSAASTYSGNTLITNGTLKIGYVASLPTVTTGTLQRWFDATDVNGNGSIPANGSALSIWSDKSALTQSATTAGGTTPTYVANGINGKPSVQLGANSYLSFPTTGLADGANESTIFAVGQLTSPVPGWDWMVAYGNSGGQQARGIGATGGSQIDYTVFGSDVQAPPTLSTGSPILADAVFGGAGSSVAGYYNYNGSFGSVSMNPALNTVLTSGNIGKQVGGFNEYWAGQVGEVLIYNGALSDADRQAVEAYLNSKWNGPQVLPASTDLSISSGGTLDLGGNSQQIGSLTGAGMVTNSGPYGATLTIGGTTSPAPFSGVIADGSNKVFLVKSGSGEMILLGANTYTGATTVSGGTLQLGDGAAGHDGSLATSGIANNAALVYNVGVTQGASYPISGAGSVSKLGNGTLTLYAANTYYGPTTLSSGTLVLSNSGAVQNSTVTMSGGSLVFDSTVSGNAFTFGALSAGSAGPGYDIALQNNALVPAPVALTVGGNNAWTVYAGVLSGGGSLTKTGNGMLTLTGSNTHSGGTTITGGILEITTDAQLGTPPSSPAVNVTLNGGQLFNNVSAPSLDPNRTISLGPNGGFVRAGWGQPFTFNGQITGSGGFGVVWDGGAVTLANSGNNYNGDTTIGTVGNGAYTPGIARLDLGINNAIPSGGGKGNVVFGTDPDPKYLNNQAILNLNGYSAQINGLTGGTNAVIDNYAAGGPYTLTVGNNNQSSTFGGIIQSSKGTVALTKTGSGALTLIGTNTYSGLTTVSGGTLQLGDGTAGHDSTLAGNVVNNAAVVFNVSGNQVYPGATIGSGSFTKTGPGTLMLTASQSYSGSTIITAGTLKIQAILKLPDITGTGISLQRWFDATDVNANGTATTSGTISTWADKSGATQNATTAGSIAPAVVLNAINGKPAVQLGVNSYLSFPTTGLAGGSSASTIFAVGQLTSPVPGWDWMVAYGNSGDAEARGVGMTSGSQIDYTAFGHDVQAPPTISTGIPIVADAVFGGAGSSVVGYYNYNGSSGSVSMTPDLNTVVTSGNIGKQVGGYNEFWAGQVGEVLIYNGALSDAQRQAIESYLEYKWDFASPGSLSNASPLLIASGATLDLGGGSEQVASLSDYSPGSGGNIINSSSNPSVLAVSSTSGATTFSGTIQDGAGSVKLVLSGSGALVLAGSNTYTGGTEVTGGTLIVTNASGLEDGTSLSVGADANTIFGVSATGATPKSMAVSPVPEPGTLTLLIAGLMVALGVRQRRRA